MPSRYFSDEFIQGFKDAVKSDRPHAPLFGRQDYYDGYAVGSEHRDDCRVKGVTPEQDPHNLLEC